MNALFTAVLPRSMASAVRLPRVSRLYPVLAIYLGFWGLVLTGNVGGVAYAVGNTLFQTLFSLCAAGVFYRGSARLLPPRQFTFRVFAVGSLFLALSDAVYGVLFNVLAVPGIAGSIHELWFNVPYAIFWISALIGFRSIVSTFPRLLLRLAWGFNLLLAVILFTAVYAVPLLKDQTPLICKVVHMLCIFGKCSVLSFGTFCLAFSSHRGLRLVSAGSLMVAGYCCLSEYLEIYGKLPPLSAAEIIWTLGVFLVALGSGDRSWRSRKPWADVRSIRPLIFLAFAGLGITGLVLPMLVDHLATVLHWKIPYADLGFLSMAVVIVVAGWASRMGRQALHETVLGSPTWNAREFAALRHARIRAARSRQHLLQFCHDMGSPLTALRVAADGLKGTDAENRALVVEAAERFSTLSEDFLARARSAPRVGDTPAVSVQLQMASTNVLAIYPRFRANFSLLLDPALDDFEPAVDSWGIAMLLGNLLRNSAEAAEARGLGSQMAIRGRLAQGSAQLEVEDDCGGIAAPVLERLRRGERLTTKAQGNGIGLSGWIARLQELGGSMAFENDGFAGRGARIVVTIPPRT